MVGGSRTLNDFSIRPKLTTFTNFVTTILAHTYTNIQLQKKNAQYPSHFFYLID